MPPPAGAEASAGELPTSGPVDQEPVQSDRHLLRCLDRYKDPIYTFRHELDGAGRPRANDRLGVGPPFQHHVPQRLTPRGTDEDVSCTKPGSWVGQPPGEVGALADPESIRRGLQVVAKGAIPGDCQMDGSPADRLGEAREGVEEICEALFGHEATEGEDQSRFPRDIGPFPARWFRHVFLGVSHRLDEVRDMVDSIGREARPDEVIADPKGVPDP